jgi:hypothetical protein
MGVLARTSWSLFLLSGDDMATETGGVRISFEVPKEVNDKLTAMCPWGTKAEAVRSLIEVLIEAQLKENVYIVQDLIRGNCKLIVKDRGVQNLNNPVQS